jgi:hypothetical protein
MRVKGNLKPVKSSKAFDTHLSFASSFQQDLTTLPAHLALLFKRLSKRDPVSLLKALEDLLATFSTLSEDELDLFLPLWPGLLSKLILHPDKRVRVCLFQCHLACIQVSKKKMALILKNVMGPWLNARFDPQTQALAQSALETAFPSKLLQALILCQESVLDYLEDLLLLQTVESLSDARFVSLEEQKSTFSRMITAAIYSLVYLLESFDANIRSQYQDKYLTILHESKFWNFCHHESPSIRIAMYEFIKMLVLKESGLILSFF